VILLRAWGPPAAVPRLARALVLAAPLARAHAARDGMVEYRPAR
jgi:hypothetical protein